MEYREFYLADKAFNGMVELQILYVKLNLFWI